ncbi:MAG: HupE/UreJ family protein [Rubricella sp.]
MRALLILIVTLLAALPLQAHETQPAIADARVNAERVELDVALLLEPLIAGIDLSRYTDTNDAPQAEEYDRLRALPPQMLDAAFEDAWPGLREGFIIEVGGERLIPRITGLAITDQPNLNLVREATLSLTAELPPGTAPVTIGWVPEYGPLVLRQIGEGEDLYAGYLNPGDLSAPLPREGVAQVPLWIAFADYVVIGFEHIVPKGLDHILFVLGLFFFSTRLRPLVFQISAFTVAHTVTLALAVLGYVSVPPEIVEPLIAASIVYVAVENTVMREMKPWRTAIVFAFGLLHGLGFASVLGDIGLDPTRFVTGLIAFNIGVEIGQLSVIAAAFLLLGWAIRRDWYRAAIAIPASLAIAAVGAYWVLERTIL